VVIALVSLLAITPLVAQIGFQNIKIDGNLIFPQVAVGGGYQMMVVLMNLNTATRATGTLHLYRSDGQPLEVIYTGGRSANIPVTLDAGATLYIPLLAISTDLRVGWALLEMVGQHPLVYGSVIYTRMAQDQVASQIGVIGSRYQLGNFMRIMAPATVNFTTSSGSNVDTGIAVVNAGAETMRIEFSLVDTSGKSVATNTIDFPSGNQMAKFVTELFPQYFAGQANRSFQGLLKIEANKEGMVALALLMSGSIMTSVPVVPLPRTSVTIVGN
jgi:hypothetical protein